MEGVALNHVGLMSVGLIIVEVELRRIFCILLDPGLLASKPAPRTGQPSQMTPRKSDALKLGMHMTVPPTTSEARRFDKIPPM